MLRSTTLLITAGMCLASHPKQQANPLALPAAERKQVLQLLLDLPDLQAFYHAELPERHPLKLATGPFVTPELRLIKFEQPVLLLSPQELQQRRIRDYVRVVQLQLRQDTLDFSLSYPIEGALVDGKLVRKGKTWQVSTYSVVEQ